MGDEQLELRWRVEKRGRPRKGSRIERIAWDEQPLGQVSDATIARALGVSPNTVRKRRDERGIPPVNDQSEARARAASIEWDTVGLGERTDYAIAQDVGVSATTVYRHRLQRGIAAGDDATALVYAIENPATLAVKVGLSAFPAWRCRKLSWQIGMELTLLGVEEGGAERERELHESFAPWRTMGEWFEPAPLVMDWVRGLRPPPCAQ